MTSSTFDLDLSHTHLLNDVEKRSLSHGQQVGCGPWNLLMRSTGTFLRKESIIQFYLDLECVLAPPLPAVQWLMQNSG